MNIYLQKECTCIYWWQCIWDVKHNDIWDVEELSNPITLNILTDDWLLHETVRTERVKKRQDEEKNKTNEAQGPHSDMCTLQKNHFSTHNIFYQKTRQKYVCKQWWWALVFQKRMEGEHVHLSAQVWFIDMKHTQLPFLLQIASPWQHI